MSADPAIHAVVAEFDDPHRMVDAVRTVRELGYRKIETYTPFAIHGMDDALGLKRSRLGWIVLAAGALGALSAVMLVWWTSAIDYPLNIAGKPLFAFEYAMPIIFELTVLFAAFGALLGMLALNLLPRFYHPIFEYSRFEHAADDRFLIAIEPDSAGFDAEKAQRVLRSAGGSHVEVVAG